MSPCRSCAIPERAQQEAFVHDLLERLISLPGVAAAGATTTAPFYAGTESAAFTIEGTPPPARGFFVAHSRAVTPRYFETLGIPLLAGRVFTDADTATSIPAVIVSQSMAQRYWPGQNPIGRRVKRGPLESAAPWMEVVGVVGSLRENPDDDIPTGDAWYLPYQQATAGSIAELTYVIKKPRPASIVPAVRSALAASDPDLPLFDAVTMEERFARFTATERLSANLTAMLGILGVFLAAVGVYAVLAFSVRQRLPELGIRAALGARPSDVRRDSPARSRGARRGKHRVRRRRQHSRASVARRESFPDGRQRACGGDPRRRCRCRGSDHRDDRARCARLAGRSRPRDRRSLTV